MRRKKSSVSSMVILLLVMIGTYGWNKLQSQSPSPEETSVSSQTTKSDDRDNTSTIAYGNESYEIPSITVKDLPSQILQRYSYTTSYNKDTRNPNWVGWALTSDHTDGEYARKNHSFTEDTDVPEPRATYADIREGECGYQRGHMCPAGDNKWAYEAQQDAFLMTNICPQNGNLNQHDWKYLEEACRTWAQKYGKIYIVAGPLFYDKNYKTVGENRVAVPDAFFKVILRTGSTSADTKAIGFIYANQTGHHKMDYYVRTVDEVEEASGYDFFHQLDDSIEDAVERSSDLNEW